MQLKTIRHIANKELNLFFSSPIAYLFLGTFIALTLVFFFLVKSFFVRNIADIRPMFELMPSLLIFLSSALTMRMWSEERRSGTLEHVLTLPVTPWSFILGKFAACKTLLLIALVLTLPLAISVSWMGDVDWGPIISGYIATMFLGSAYIAVGLFISSRSDNQIVSFILSVAVCGFLYALGSDTLTKFLDQSTAELFRSMGTGSRFESITRGLLDLRDLYYYVSITLIFLVLNRYTLEKERWAKNKRNVNHSRWRLFAALAIANLFFLNLWLSPLNFLRTDTTKGKIYSISESTENYIDQLKEPLLIRGYFSEKTHPLLSPLVPQIKDLIQEYEVSGAGKIRIDLIDPAKNPEAEAEAGEKYGIRPSPFRVEDKYQSAVVNSYFNILISYGDEYKVLSFQDLIEVNQTQSGDIDVQLKNPEYDLTNAIKSVLYSYQSAGNLFENIKSSLDFTAYISNTQKLPKSLADLSSKIQPALEKVKADANGKFNYSFVDPNENNGAIAKEIAQNYGFQPMATSLFDENSFYFYLVLQSEETAVQIPIPEEMNIESFERSLDAALKRFSSGFTKTVGLVAPEQNPYAAQIGQAPSLTFNAARQMLSENLSVKDVNLNEGVIPTDADLLMVLSPENLSEKAVFAMDQFLMQGGTVIAATSPYKVNFSQQSLSATNNTSGIEDWLSHHGINIDKTFIMDEQNAFFPMPVRRRVGMFEVQEMELINYPYFSDARGKGLNKDNAITASLQQLTIPWSSPLNIDQTKNSNRSVVPLISSSDQSWLNSSTQLTPVSTGAGQRAFSAGTVVGSQLMAASISGQFTSYFENKPSPLLENNAEPSSAEPNDNDASSEETNNEETNEQSETENTPAISGLVSRSPDSARLIVVSSNSFAEDHIVQVLSAMSGNSYLTPFEFLTNAIEWSLEDSSLLSIRSRAHFNRTLPPMKEDEKRLWETLNYAFAFVSILFIFGVRTFKHKRKTSRYLDILKTEGTVERGAIA